jgi:hypothetical protein
LAGWRKARKSCFPPTCDSFITKKNKESVHALIRHLFNQRWNIFDSLLTEFVLVMFAILLVSLTEMVEEFGESTLVNVIIQRAARKFRFDKETLKVFILYFTIKFYH